MLWPEGHIGKTPSAYEQLFKGKEAQIVYYKFKDKLPDVAPSQKADSRPPRATVKIAKQSIVSSPKNAPKGMQTVWQPAPKLIQKEVLSANVLAMKAPDRVAPERKKFVPPAPQQNPARTVAEVKVAEAPKTLAAAPPTNPLSRLAEAPRLSVRNMPEFHAPAAQNNRTVTATPEAGAPPQLAGLQGSAANIAVVGLKPIEQNVVPQGSRATEFSAGPKLNPDGGTGGDKGLVSVPDLFVHGGGEAKPTLTARLNPPPSAAENLRALARSAPVVRSTPTNEPPHPLARRVSSAPTARFEGREVYSMAIQMPNITSYSGSWLMWYAGRSAPSAESGPIAPPIPHRKVDPKYIATAAEERIEGRVQLLCVIRGSGKVDQVELLHGIDGRLNQSAMEALSKWEFTPATRSGVPVDVDVMVEIPFKLAPKAGRP